MRYAYFSDPHCNADPHWFPLIEQPVDIILCAGDIHINIHKSLAFLQRLTDTYHVPVVSVLGNHDYEDHSIHDVLDIVREYNHRHTGVTVLENDVFTLGHVDIFGATLWSNFELYGATESYFALQAAKNMQDFERIRYGEHPLSPRYVKEMCFHSTQWLTHAIHESTASHKIMLTHFSPHPSAIRDAYGRQAINAYFANDIPALYGYVDTVIHGHTHHSSDVTLAHGTQILCNARGHRSQRLNPDFRIRYQDVMEPMGPQCTL